MFKTNLGILILILFFSSISFTYGFISYHNHWFPYKQLQALKHSIAPPTLNANHVRASMFELFPHHVDAVMIGDSITHLGEWSDIFPDTNIANRGINGNTVEDILNRLDPILALKANKAFIMVGINDIYKNLDTEIISTNYERLIEILRQENTQVFIQSTIECSRSKCGSRTLNKIRKLNKKLEKYSADENITFIDLNIKLSSPTAGLLEAHTYDGIHLNALGYAVWRDIIIDYVQ